MKRYNILNIRNIKCSKLNYFIFLTIVLSICSCSDFLNLEPETSLSSAVAFDNLEGIDAGINGAYSIIHSDWVERQYVFAECLASNVKEVNSLGNSNYQDALRHQSWVDLSETSGYLWSMSYAVIDLMNQIIKAIPDVPETDQNVSAEKTRLLGEALFLRGLQYFVLNRFFAQPQNGLSVPISLNPFAPEDQPSRASIEETKNQVIADFLDAEKLLEGTESNNGRATIWAVKGMLARAYFEYKDYSNASTSANDVINNGRVDGRKLELLSEDLSAPYSGNFTSENIFTFIGLSNDRANNRMFEIFSVESAAVELSVSESFWDVISVDKSDLRIKQLHQDFNVAVGCHKYNDRDMNMPYLRLPEMYLIRAESEANLGNLDVALEDLNRLRARAGLEASSYSDQSDLLEQIFIDRSIELSMEGDNFHNLKRLQRPIGGYSWEEASYKLVFFIPQKEVELNPNIVQNAIW